MIQEESIYFSIIASHAPKWFLMAIVATVLIISWRRAALDQQSRRLAYWGLALSIVVVVLSPLLYGLLAWVTDNGVTQGMTWWYALVGGVLTMLECAGLLLLGLAVSAGRRRPD